ncbi:uncharacterized protein N7473_010947 [Penicillium subrubescens]|uniref:uncharacterized protein n=1 Tax=Penicillium subrubescens TaxID=1316194 RepID=UPI002544E1ED|nr:uncharacterized protein N7473_010947 [Penicillium subrubescens]KAJ5884061.1 hypothetical protein N7473_010947 [Penicillium subrubescens]
MAIFDSEKRPRGLRVPSLTAMKNGSSATKSQFSFHSKKSTDSRPDSSSTPSLTTIISAPQTKPKDLPPPPNKDLPPTPKEELPQPVSAQAPPRSSSMVPPRREVLRKPPPSGTSPITGAPKLGLRQPSQQAPASGIPVVVSPQAPQSQSQLQLQSQTRPAQSQPAYTQAQPPITQSLPGYHAAQAAPAPPTPQSQVQAQPAQTNQASRGPAPTPTPSQAPPPNLTPAPPQPSASTDALTPLEDFIPTPDGGSTPLDQTSSDEQASYTPSDDTEPIAAPLSKIHYACFQEHRNMPVAKNTWCPVPCMTCQKMDREIRHRGVGGGLWLS